MVRFAAYRRVALAALLVVLLGLSLAPASPTRGATSGVVLPSPIALSSLLTATRRPPRDLYTQTARLKLHITTSINPYVSTTPTDYPVGRVDSFYGGNAGISDNPAAQRKAVLLVKTAHAYFYVQQGLSVDLAALTRSAHTFEQHTYPTDRAIYGSEWTPGVDNDRHITIFNGQVPGAEAYFYAEDLYPRSVNPYSNQRKMIYVNLGSEQPGTTSYDLTLAHEFQHMIHAHLHPADEAWINEGSSVLAQVLNGYSSSGYENAKADGPDTQLDAWDPNNSIPYYGGGFLWMLYLYEHFGGARAIRTELADSSLSNMALFDDVLAKLGVHQHVDDVFADWLIANFLNDRSFAGGRYGYTHTTVRSVTTSKVGLPFSQSSSMHQYAANYIDIPSTGGQAFTLRFTGQPTVPLLGTVAPPQGFWWSNRGDNVDTTLTLPPFDLRGVRHATLHYQTWYDLEKDYDYAYVEVSTDGGKTWYAQHTPHTTGTNPVGNNLAVGYTGSSCNPSSADHACWVNEQLDLSPYAGKKVLVRFEQSTDDEYNGQGMAVAHIQLPELGFDGDSTSAGWQSAGWVRTGNTLAERWIVQAIVFSPNGAINVVQMPVSADGRGTLPIPAGSRRVVMVVSPVAPLTTVTNRYTLAAGSTSASAGLSP